MTVQRVQHPVHPLCIHVIILNMVRAMNPEGQNNALRQQNNVIMSTLQHNALSCSCSHLYIDFEQTICLSCQMEQDRRETMFNIQVEEDSLHVCNQSKWFESQWMHFMYIQVTQHQQSGSLKCNTNHTQTFQQRMTQCWQTCFNFVVHDGQPMCPALCCACLQKIRHGHLQNVSQDKGRRGLNTNHG